MHDPQRWVLKPVHIRDMPPWIDIDAEQGLALGRAADNDISLAAAEHAGVSSHHARLSQRDGHLVLTDLGSTNGTFVNGIRTREQTLHAGDVISLGVSGPRFVVESRADLGATALIEPARAEHRFGDSTISLVRAAVGLSPDTDVGSIVARSRKRMRRALLGTVAAVMAIVGIVSWFAYTQSHAQVQRLEGLNEQLRQALAATNSALDEQQAAWETQKLGLENQKAELTARLLKLEVGDRDSATTITELRERLAATDRSLAMFDPVNLERARLDGVRAVREAVVFIETAVRLRDEQGDGLLHAEQRADGSVDFSIEGAGELVAKQKTGSGFVASRDGLILTNAHVVEAAGAFADRTEIEPQRFVVPDVAVEVIFNGKSERHRARVLAERHDEFGDFAVLKIEPFEGMPYLADFRTDHAVPAEGAEVYLFGFPLGRAILQSGDSVVASTFKGIYSRRAGHFLQVDAAVHPGNSGGPATDAAGRVIGIVTAVARMPDGSITPSIGYVIPIAAIDELWKSQRGG